jgi:hypothetical protein
VIYRPCYQKIKSNVSENQAMRTFTDPPRSNPINPRIWCVLPSRCLLHEQSTCLFLTDFFKSMLRWIQARRVAVLAPVPTSRSPNSSFGTLPLIISVIPMSEVDISTTYHVAPFNLSLSKIIRRILGFAPACFRASSSS